MANFGINLDLKLNGQNAVDRAVRGAKSLEAAVKRINDKPLNLANIGGAARLEGLGAARKQVIDLAKALNKGTKDIGKTEVAIRETLSVFSELAANTEKGTSTFNEFTAVVNKAEKKLNDIARASENAKRAQKGMMSLEQREAQLEKRSNTLRILRTKKKLKDDEAKSRKKNADAIDKENKKLERQNKLDKKAAKRNRGRAIGDVAASVGFPLLFGGGAGSVAGGATGSVLGSLLGVGFGGQILGSAIGQQFDKLIVFATEAGDALNNPLEQFEELIRLSGELGRSVGGQQGLLKALGLTEVAALQAANTFEEAYGEKTVSNLKKLSDASRNFQDAMVRLGITIASVLSGPVGALINGLARLMPATRADQISERLVDIRIQEQALNTKLQGGINPKALTLAEKQELKKQGKPIPEIPTFLGSEGMSLSERSGYKTDLKKLQDERVALEEQHEKLVQKTNQGYTKQLDITKLISTELEKTADIEKRRIEETRIIIIIIIERKKKKDRRRRRISGRANNRRLASAPREA